MRHIAAAALALVLIACSNSSSPTASSARTSGTTTRVSAAGSKAADFRTRLDLLLGEQVMIVAKETEAAVNHGDDYVGYTNLLATNTDDLTSLMRSAFGNTAASQLGVMRSQENGYLVDYAIGVVTHNDAKSSGAMSGLQNGVVPQFSLQLANLTQLPEDPIAQLMAQQVLETKVLIDDEAAQKFSAVYTDLHTVYAQCRRIGDAIAPRTTQNFPDKFPGDATDKAVDSRVTLAMLLQESSYLATMVGSAMVAGRQAEVSAATNALTANADSLGTVISGYFGNTTGTQFDVAWADRDRALAGYATSADTASRQLLDASVAQFARLARIDPALVDEQASAAVKVIVDQRARNSQALAADDRAAATAMQPIGDAISAQG